MKIGSLFFNTSMINENNSFEIESINYLKQSSNSMTEIEKSIKGRIEKLSLSDQVNQFNVFFHDIDLNEKIELILRVVFDY